MAAVCVHVLFQVSCISGLFVLVKNLPCLSCSVKISSEPAVGFMRTCAADCRSMPLTSQMVGLTQTRSESESSPLLCLTGRPLADPPHLSVTRRLKCIDVASVPLPGLPLAETSLVCSRLSDIPVTSQCPRRHSGWFINSSDQGSCCE